jgi:hypothetical protein
VTGELKMVEKNILFTSKLYGKKPTDDSSNNSYLRTIDSEMGRAQHD